MTAYVHIGTVKTGSTSIQYLLNRNRSILAKQGFYYPQSMIFLDRHRIIKMILEEYIQNSSNSKYTQISQCIKTEKYKILIQNLKKEINLNRDKKILFSDEGFSWWFSHKEKVKVVRKFFSEIGFTKIIIILYLREFQDFFISLSSQDIKDNGIFKTNLLAKENPNINSYDYSYICKNYSEVFGKENIIVRLFDKNEFYQGDLIKDFLNIINLKWDDNFMLPPRTNESLDLLGFELQRRLNLLNLGGYISTDNKNSLLKFTEKYFHSKTQLLKFQPKKDILQSYLDYLKESDEWVRKEFFPHKERLFPKKDLTNYKENYELKEMKSEYWDKIAEFIADIVKTKNKIISQKILK